jgi:hypothetical protein
MRFIALLLCFAFPLVYINAQSRYLVIGKGGGISGEVTYYKILNKGKVYKGSDRAEMSFASKSKISKADAKKIYSDLKSITDSSFSHPGNMYYFVTITGEGPEISYTWGDSGFKVPDGVGELYRAAMAKVAKLTFKELKDPVK